MANVLITGSRSIINQSFVGDILRKELNEGDVLIHGGANGVDSIAQEFCDDNGFASVIVRPVDTFKGVYYLHGNAEMIGMCNRVIAFWDGKSRGTDFTVRYAKARKLDVQVFEEAKEGLKW